MRTPLPIGHSAVRAGPIFARPGLAWFTPGGKSRRTREPRLSIVVKEGVPRLIRLDRGTLKGTKRDSLARRSGSTQGADRNISPGSLATCPFPETNPISHFDGTAGANRLERASQRKPGPRQTNPKSRRERTRSHGANELKLAARTNSNSRRERTQTRGANELRS